MATQPIFNREYHLLQLLRPSQEQIDECTQRTAAALGLVDPNSKHKTINAARQQLIDKTNPNKPTYMSLTSQHTGQQRTIEIHDVVDDPLTLAKFKTNKKLKREPSPPPVSFVDHSVSRTTQAELAKWKVPTAISNWTNNKAGVIDLAVRSMFDYDASNEISISAKHSTLSASLDKTLQQNRHEIEARNRMHQAVEQAKREKEEREMTALATKLQTHGAVGNSADDLQPTMAGYGYGYDNEQGDQLGNLEDVMSGAQSAQQHEALEKQVRQNQSHSEAMNRRNDRYKKIEAEQTEQDSVRTRQRDISDAIVSTAVDSALTNIQLGGSNWVDDQVAQAAQNQNREFNDEDPYEDDHNQSSKSKTFHNIHGASAILNDTNGLGKGALTREQPVLFEKHTTISATNTTNQNTTTTTTTTNNNNNGTQRDRDRNYQ